MLDHPAENRSPYARIPGGQHGLAPELVSADQRARLNAAMVQVAAETGYVDTTVEDVIGRAGVSRRTFYDNYTNKQACFISAFDAVLGDWMRQSAVAYQTSAPNGMQRTVRARLRAGLLALFELVLSDPLGARVLFVETLNCGSPGLQRLEHAVDELERILERAFGVHDGPPEPPPGMITVIVGGVLEIVTSRLRHSRTDELLELAEPLAEWILSYRSTDAAALATRAREDVAGPAAGLGTERLGGKGDGDLGSFPLWRDESVRPVAVREPRDRIIEAAAQIASDRGYRALSLNEIARAARVSHHTLRKYFATKTEAFMAAYQAGSRATIAYCLTAFSAETDWRTAVHAGLAAELRFLAMHPELARIGFLEIYAAGSQLLELRETELQLVTAALEPGYSQKRRSAPPHPIVSEAIAGGIYQLMRELVLHHEPEQLPSLLPDVTYAALAPFVGAKAAASVASRPGRGAQRGVVREDASG